jgi:hypothetical protein
MGRDTMKPASRKRLDPIGFACGGSLVGMALFALYDTYTITADTIMNGSDFACFFVGMAVFVVCGASMLALAAGLWNRRLQSAPSDLSSDEWTRKPSSEETGHFNDVIISFRCRPATAPVQSGKSTAHRSKPDLDSPG